MSLLAGALFALLTQTPAHAAAPELRAGLVKGPMRIDARLDESDWLASGIADRFTQTDPAEGKPASERTEVRVLIDEHALYIGARLYDREPRKIRATLGRRDEDVESDYFEVFLDSYHDHLSAVRFRITPAGAIEDAVLGSSAQGSGDDVSWDPVWEYAARVDSLGWTAELRIPLAQLRYNSTLDGRWGIQLHRQILRKGEDDWFSLVPKNEAQGVNRYGHLTGLGTLKAERLLELRPYTLARAAYTQARPGDPFQSGHDYNGSAGLDLKYGLTSDLTLDATINPDFGQVEVDPAVVNLSAFETFFPEKRPFFVEGADVFRFGGIRAFNSFGFPRFFFSRRIGRQPQRSIGGAGFDFVDAPTETSIRAATKLSGRTRGGWSVGVIDAVTAEEQAQYLDGGGVAQETPIEPLTNYFVGRVRKDLQGGNTTVGLMTTAVNRDLSDPTLASQLRGQGYLGGLDFNHSWSNRNWSLDGAVAMSTVRGSASSIALTQQSSARYYQRPDATSFTYDPTRESLSGHAFQMALARNGGGHWLGGLVYQETSPSFESNDLGFESNADRRAVSTALIYQENTPGRYLRNFQIYPFTNHAWNFDGDLVFGSYGLILQGTLRNFWGYFLRGDFAPASFDDRLTRGGPVAGQPPTRDFSAQISSDSRRTTRLSANVFHSWTTAGERNTNLGGSISFRPTAAARISLGPSITKNHTLSQYVTAVADPAATATYGTRYVFGTLDQTEVSLDLRVYWTFTPKLSLQLYAQPLISAGDYSNIKELAAPRTYRFAVYGIDRGSVTPTAGGGSQIDPGDGGATFAVGNPDFNFRSLRANAVLRWEWHAGSTLFLVWQQARQGQTDVGDFRFGRDVGALFDAHGDNVFAIKASYWLGL